MESQLLHRDLRRRKSHSLTRQWLIENLPKAPVWAISGLLLEDFDANSADVIPQSLLFGEVIYG